MKCPNPLYILVLFLMACTGPDSTDTANQIPATATASLEENNQVIEGESPPQISKHNKWDGFYFYDMGMGRIIVIEEGKYYNFERKDFRSFYKDFEYDIAFSLNEDGFIPIVKEYYLDRKKQLTSKDKILFDTKPIEEAGKTIGLDCREKKYTHLHAFEEYVAKIHVSKTTLIEEIKANSKYQDDELIAKALKDPDFVRKSKMTQAPLRQQTLAFWQLVVNIIEAK